VASPSEPSLTLVPEELPDQEHGPANSMRFWRGLLWSEWFAHSRLILVFIFLWLAAVWLLPLFAHPLWILMVGVGYALTAGPAFGGMDVIHGCEEFTFTLPPTRSDRFWARLAVGGGGLLVLTLITVYALEANLSDVLFRLVLDSGLGGVELRRPELLYGLVFAFPFAIFAIGFTVAALTTRRTIAFTAWIWAALGGLASLRAGAYVEDQVWDRFNGRVTVPGLFATAFLTLSIGRQFYRRKEAGEAGAPLRMPLSWWGGMGLLMLAGLGVAALLVWLASNLPRLL